MFVSGFIPIHAQARVDRPLIPSSIRRVLDTLYDQLTALEDRFTGAPPTVHQMVLTLERSGLIERTAGKARSIRLRLSRAQLPDLE